MSGYSRNIEARIVFALPAACFEVCLANRASVQTIGKSSVAVKEDSFYFTPLAAPSSWPKPG